MIIGKIKDIGKYKNLSKNLDIAIDYITSNHLVSLQNGHNEVLNDKVFINKFSYTSNSEENCFFEGHKNYVDIHIVLSGKELLLGYSDISDLTPTTEYDSINDFTKYEGKVTTYCQLTLGNFIITFPEDIHMPKISIDNDIVEKIVVKVLYN